MKIRRVIPPSASPIYLKDLFCGVTGLFQGKRYVKRFEDEIRRYFDVRHVFLVSSGKAAMVLILKALESLMPGKKSVLIPAYTCFSVPSAIVKAGLKVSLCDINQTTLDFACELLENSINEETLCVIPNHLFGIPSDIESIRGICKDKGIFFVEDAAQAMGVSYRGRKLGTHGDVGFLSLGRGKNITCGSGGIILTNSDSIGEAINRYYSDIESPDIKDVLKEFFQVVVMSIFVKPALYWLPSGLPQLKLGETVFHKDFPIMRFSGMKAGLLRKWRERLELSNHIREETSIYFRNYLGLNVLNIKPLPYLRLPVIINSKGLRDRIYENSYKQGLGISLMYPTPVNEIKEISEGFTGEVFPVASKIAESLLAIPTHQFLTEKDKKAICELFKSNVNEEGELKCEAYNYN